MTLGAVKLNMLARAALRIIVLVFLFLISLVVLLRIISPPAPYFSQTDLTFQGLVTNAQVVYAKFQFSNSFAWPVQIVAGLQPSGILPQQVPMTVVAKWLASHRSADVLMAMPIAVALPRTRLLVGVQKVNGPFDKFRQSFRLMLFRAGYKGLFWRIRGENQFYYAYGPVLPA